MTNLIDSSLTITYANQVKKDDVIPDLLILQPRTDLHNHPLVMNGSVFLQVLWKESDYISLHNIYVSIMNHKCVFAFDL